MRFFKPYHVTTRTHLLLFPYGSYLLYNNIKLAIGDFSSQAKEVLTTFQKRHHKLLTWSTLGSAYYLYVRRKHWSKSSLRNKSIFATWSRRSHFGKRSRVAMM